MTLRRTTAALATTSLLAVPMLALTATPASAVERSTRCDGGRAQLEVEKDDGRFEVNLDIDARRGTQWKIVLKQDGKAFANLTRRAGSDGDVDLDRNRPDTAGKDVFTARVNQVGTPGGCTLRIVR